MRIKRGQVKKQKHKKILKLTKGYRMSYSKLYRKAKEAVLHAGSYSYSHRRHRRSQIRGEWIKILSSSLSQYKLSYSSFINSLSKKKVVIDRKNLAELATFQPEDFKKVVEFTQN